MPRPPRLVDVSVLLAPGLATYPGNPEFEMHAGHRIAEGHGSNNSRLVMGTHTGTHVDAPLHFFDGRPGVDALPLELLIGRARVIDLPHRGGITEQHLAAAGLREDLRVLLRTPNSALWNTHDGFHPDYTYLTEGGAKFLVGQGVKVVGDRLPVGRAIQQGRRAGAPGAARQRRDHHRRPQPVRGRGRAVRDVLPAAAHRQRRRRARQSGPEAMSAAATTSSSWCWPGASASGSRR